MQLKIKSTAAQSAILHSWMGFPRNTTYEMKSPLNSSDQDKICHKLFVNFLDLCPPSNMLMKPGIAKPITKVFASMSLWINQTQLNGFIRQIKHIPLNMQLL